jgi:hypothetical protein
MNATSIIKSIEGVTSDWTKQRKREERSRNARWRRRAALMRSYRVTVKEAAWQVMEEAYLKASGGGKYPASARQIMYAARGCILEMTGRESLDSQYFAQTILPNYLAAHPKKTADWDVVYDARGHFAEPHTESTTALGTLNVRDYLASIEAHTVEDIDAETLAPNGDFPTKGPRNRFGAVLFIEKEGFLPLFEAVKLAERYDIAVMSTKGMPVVACRRLADELCGAHHIPLLVLHDFDKAGFSIVGTLRGVLHYDRDFNKRDSRYEYQHNFDVIDLGLRLADVEAYGLESEDVSYKSDPRQNLKDNGATQEEVAFLCGEVGWHGYRGRRVELNAFTSDKFVGWIEKKLKHHGIKKVIPDDDTLATAYRRAVQADIMRDRLEEIVEEADEEASKTNIPKGLRRAIAKRLKQDPAIPWDQAVSDLAAGGMEGNCKKHVGAQRESKQAKSVAADAFLTKRPPKGRR